MVIESADTAGDERDHGGVSAMSEMETVGEMAASAGQIEVAQRDLNGMAYGAGAVDGILGPQTKRAIGRFQHNWNLSVTDHLNSHTYKRIKERVRVIQEHVHVSADGIYGSHTRTAVERFQHSAGLPVDGICGPATSRAMGIAYRA